MHPIIATYVHHHYIQYNLLLNQNNFCKVIRNMR